MQTSTGIIGQSRIKWWARVLQESLTNTVKLTPCLKQRWDKHSEKIHRHPNKHCIHSFTKALLDPNLSIIYNLPSSILIRILKYSVSKMELQVKGLWNVAKEAMVTLNQRVFNPCCQVRAVRENSQSLAMNQGGENVSGECDQVCGFKLKSPWHTSHQKTLTVETEDVFDVSYIKSIHQMCDQHLWPQ